MDVATLSTSGENSLLPALRGELERAESALLCVAFVESPGVHLLNSQLERLGADARLLMTTVFKSRTSALGKLHQLGVGVSILNPPSGTYHPKVYLARRGNEASMVVGSSNLTGGLVNNVEAGVLIRGRMDDEPLRKAWEWGEELWRDPRAQRWTPSLAGAMEEEEQFDPVLFQLLGDLIRREGNRFMTLGPDPRPNAVRELTPTGIYVDTNATRKKRTPPQLIPAWMFTLAWDYLRSHGSLSNAYLVASDGLNVKRSSAICAILSRLPGVRLRPGGRIVLEHGPQS